MNSFHFTALFIMQQSMLFPWKYRQRWEKALISELQIFICVWHYVADPLELFCTVFKHMPSAIQISINQ